MVCICTKQDIGNGDAPYITLPLLLPKLLVLSPFWLWLSVQPGC